MTSEAQHPAPSPAGSRHLAPPLLSGLGTLASGLSFEESQLILQRAAAQLSLEDQSERQSQDRIAVIEEQILRDAYERAVDYDLPIDERMEMSHKFLNPGRLAELEFQLSLTPTGLAARYIRWCHESLGTDAPDPLPGWLTRLESELHRRYPCHNPHRIFRNAEQQIYIMVELYAYGLLGWIEEFRDVLPLVVMAACSTRNQHLAPEVSALLAELFHRLSVWAAVLEIIETDYLREPVTPTDLRTALDSVQLKFSVPALSSAGRSTQDGAPASYAAESAAEAKSRVNTLLATARARASLVHCHEAILSLAQAQLTLGNHMAAYDFAMRLLAASGCHKPERKKPRGVGAKPQKQPKVPRKSGRRN